MREYEECRIKRTLVMVNLVSRRLIINRCWRGFDRYLLTADESTVSRVDILCIIDGSFFVSPSRDGPKRERKREKESLWRARRGTFQTVLLCGPVLVLLMNVSEHSSND